MCLNLRRIKNPSKHISAYSSKFFVEVKCGDCAECRQEKKLEWQHRAHAVYETTKKKGGYTLFLSLTHDEKHCPRFHGMRCFNPDEIVLFRKRLRSYIVRYKRKNYVTGQYYCPFAEYYEDNFRLLICSEYGGVTHRPHYHILLSAAIPGLTPLMLRHFVARAWTLGLIDSPQMALNHIVNSDFALKYVASYMYKDDSFTEQIRDLQEQCRKTMPKLIYNKVFSKKNLSRIYPFHRESRGYGLKEIIDENGKNFIFESGKIECEDSHNYVSRINVPMSVQRKLFYDLHDDPDNLDDEGKPRKRWLLNSLGKQFKLAHLDENIEALAKQLKEKVDNFDNFDHNSSYVSLKDYRQEIYNILDNRQFNDLAVYILCYKDKTFAESIEQPSLELPDYFSFFMDTLNSMSMAPFVEKDFSYFNRRLLNCDNFVEFVGFDAILSAIRARDKLFAPFKQGEYNRKGKLMSKYKLNKFKKFDYTPREDLYNNLPKLLENEIYQNSNVAV